MQWLRIALIAGLCLAHTAAGAAVETVFRGLAAAEVRDLIADACRTRGMAVLAAAEHAVTCGNRLSADESFLQDLEIDPSIEARFHQHMQRFELTSQPDAVSVVASAWVELLDAAGTAYRHDVTAAGYLADVQAMLHGLGAAQPGGAVATGPWQDHYAEEAEWRLDAHRRAVALCDEMLPALDLSELEAQIAAAGVHPFSEDPRGRCEELYEEVYLWGLARGVERPGVHDYVDFLQNR